MRPLILFCAQNCKTFAFERLFSHGTFLFFPRKEVSNITGTFPIEAFSVFVKPALYIATRCPLHLELLNIAIVGGWMVFLRISSGFQGYSVCNSPVIRLVSELSRK